MSDAPEFFKVFLEKQSTEHLRIPPAYHKHIRVSPPRVFHLSDPCGDTWNVALIRAEGGLYFAHGWPNFVKDHALENGDLLIFSCLDEFRFRVSIFDHTGCPKDFVRCPGAPKEVGNSKKRKGDDSASCHIVDMVGRSTSNQILRFTITINKSHIHLHYLAIPMRFARMNNLLDKGAAVIRDPSGTEWPVVLRRQDHPSMLSMNKGWRDFSIANDLKVGDICVFELLMDKIEVDKFSLAVYINKLP
ncbi:hypothetical protein SAY87_002837 [Trapa incisa]|uniref:TF-B3 domain-containing protein n=1 Tax=Trapa incisa TaxID=236973 RepID=A0AAN7KIB2_9MYRT|nr:hypothetical protein SAY87_002837 [Trapa incisa]